MNNFNYNQIVSFVQVASYKNISTAAKNLNKSRATIREHIELFEYNLGHKLFDRGSNKIKLTKIGEQILKPSLLMNTQVLMWEKSINKICSNEPSASIRIAYDIITPSECIEELLCYCMKRNIKIDVTCVSSNISLDMLDKNLLDFIIIPEESLLRSDLEWRVIGSMPYKFYSNKYLFNTNPVKASELIASVQILPRSYINKEIDEKYIFTQNNVIIDKVSLMKKALSKGLGWAFLPAHLEAETWLDVIELNTTLGTVGFVSSVEARWRPGEEMLIEPILDFFDDKHLIAG